MNSGQMIFIIFPSSRKSFTLSKEDICLFQCNLCKYILFWSSSCIYTNVFFCSLLSLQPPISHLYSLEIMLLCFVSVFPFPLLSSPLYSKNYNFQLWSITLQLIDLLKITAIRPEFCLSAVVQSLSGYSVLSVLSNVSFVSTSVVISAPLPLFS